MPPNKAVQREAMSRIELAKATKPLRQLAGDIILDIISGEPGYRMKKETALWIRAHDLIDQNPPRNRKESE